MKETFEEAAERLFPDSSIQKRIFKMCAKWQQENIPICIYAENIYCHIENGVVIVEKNDKSVISYSEEDMIEFGKYLLQSLQDCTCIEDTIDMKQSTKDRILSETSEEIKQRVRETANKLVMKQETLEDAAARLYPTDCTNWSIKIPLDERKAFIEGAKWQQERSYSEEEVLELLEKIQQQVAIDYNDEFLFAKEWFEQFKKK
jgi:hypothetical protein